MTNIPPLILASQSPRRKELLGKLGIPYTVIIQDTEEEHHERLEPQELCYVNALAKAQAIADKHPDSTVIGADTLVFLGQTPLGKPKDQNDAKAMLRSLSGKAHNVCTAVAIISPTQTIKITEITQVFFKTLSDDLIDQYMSLVNVMDKAGSYACQEHGEMIIEKMLGDFDNVVGFPTAKVAEHLTALGYLVK